MTGNFQRLLPVFSTNEIRILVPESQNCRGFDADQRRLLTDQSFNFQCIGYREPPGFTEHSFRQVGTSAFAMVGNNDPVTQFVQELYGLHPNLHFVEIGEFVGEQIDLFRERGILQLSACPGPQCRRAEQGNAALRRKPEGFPDQSGEKTVTGKKIENTRENRSKPVDSRYVGDKKGAERGAVRIIIMLQELRLQFRHVNIGRTFRLAGFAGEAKVHDVIDLLMVERVQFGGT